MKYTIIDGLPYLVSNGKLYPVKIEKNGEGYTVTIDKENGTETTEKGRYSLNEIIAKCKVLDSTGAKKAKAKKAETTSTEKKRTARRKKTAEKTETTETETEETETETETTEG